MMERAFLLFGTAARLQDHIKREQGAFDETGKGPIPAMGAGIMLFRQNGNPPVQHPSPSDEWKAVSFQQNR